MILLYAKWLKVFLKSGLLIHRGLKLVYTFLDMRGQHRIFNIEVAINNFAFNHGTVSHPDLNFIKAIGSGIIPIVS